ncbi:hypothetical protein L917_01546 [Phytophthora nicotianae]|uniref:Uncharacterized protein n=1 Tax=Phytophthora nicotianae TaxID=4792 RepID=W2LWR8_PHYNI|nr:hypothetical protein L917_01546 [Phytophthora nicotianae]
MLLVLMKLWSKPRMSTTELELEIHSAYMDRTEFSSPDVLEVAVVLSRADLTFLYLNFADVLDSDQNTEPLALTNIGFVVSTLICGRSLCASIGTDIEIPLIERQGHVRKLCLAFDSSFHTFTGVCAALASGASFGRLALWVDVDEQANLQVVQDECWSWLAYALWSKGSGCSVRELAIGGIGLSRSGLSIFKAAFQQNYPEPDLMRNVEYGLITIPEGVEVKPRAWMENDSMGLMLTHECRCRARYNNATKNVDFILPGFGICTTKADNRSKFVPDATADLSDEVVAHIPNLGSLELDLSQVESGDVLDALLKLIGSDVRSLTLSIQEGWLGVGNQRVKVDLRELAPCVPHLEELHLQNVTIFVSKHNELLRRWGLKTLEMYEADDADSLDTCLRLLVDKTLRSTRELSELEISVGQLERLNPLARGLMNAISGHIGEFLSVAKDEFPSASKAVMISVVNDCHSPQSSLQYIDASILTLIFEFAARAQQRSAWLLNSNPRKRKLHFCGWNSSPSFMYFE